METLVRRPRQVDGELSSDAVVASVGCPQTKTELSQLAPFLASAMIRAL